MKIQNISLIVAPQSAALPDGEYEGTWGGYIVIVQHEGKTYHVEVDQGIRTMAAPCTLTIRGSEAEVKLG